MINTVFDQFYFVQLIYRIRELFWGLIANVEPSSPLKPQNTSQNRLESESHFHIIPSKLFFRHLSWMQLLCSALLSEPPTLKPCRSSVSPHASNPRHPAPNRLSHVHRQLIKMHITLTHSLARTHSHTPAACIN